VVIGAVWRQLVGDGLSEEGQVLVIFLGDKYWEVGVLAAGRLNSSIDFVQ
jgi:hypothetical protein